MYHNIPVQKREAHNKFQELHLSLMRPLRRHNEHRHKALNTGEPDLIYPGCILLILIKDDRSVYY